MLLGDGSNALKPGIRPNGYISGNASHHSEFVRHAFVVTPAALGLLIKRIAFFSVFRMIFFRVVSFFLPEYKRFLLFNCWGFCVLLSVPSINTSRSSEHLSKTSSRERVFLLGKTSSRPRTIYNTGNNSCTESPHLLL